MKYLAITAILCLILAGASFAGNVTVTEVVTGNLTLTMPNNFSLPSKTLGGSSLWWSSANATYTIEDSRGTGAGWNLGFQISQFQTGGTPNRTAPADYYQMRIESPNITCTYGQPVDSTNGPKSLMLTDTDVQTSQAEGVHALADYGMGKYTIQANHTLAILASFYAGTYTATLTATLNNVP